MKISLATTASVIGVLVSATAAYALNSHVLVTEGGKPAASLAAEQSLADPGTQLLLSPSTPQDPGRVAPADVAQSAVTGAPVTPTDSQDDVSVYDLGAVGTVSLRATATSVEVVAVDSIWKVTTTNSPKGITLTFERRGQVLAFNATLDAGRIATSVQNLTPSSLAPRRPRDKARDEDHTEEHADENDDENHDEDHGSEMEDDD